MKRNFRNLALCGVASIAMIIGGANLAFAQSHSGGGSSHSDGGHDDGGHDDGGAKGKQRRGGDGTAGQRGSGGRGGDLRDVFRGMEEEAATDGFNEHGAGGKGTPGGQQGAKKQGSGRPGTAGSSESEEDSDRPDYAGPGGRDNKPGRPNTDSGIKKGGIYGDMYIVLRDENGVPILDENGYVQVKYVDANGDLQCCIPRNEEGDLLATLPDGTAVLPVEVELGRLSVGRSPTQVLAAQYDEAISLINSAESVAVDASGRIVITLSDGTEKTIDSPLENLALYYQLLTTGTLTDVDATKLGDLAFLVDGTLTEQDLAVAASFFAAASDKTVPVTVDAIIYMNTILGIDGTLNDDYVDYSSFTYDREAVYGSMEVEVLVQQSDGSWVATTVNVYDAILGGEATGELTNADAFSTATDDARAIINYLHEYEVPATE